jgi:peptidylprolyl isomerase
MKTQTLLSSLALAAIALPLAAQTTAPVHHTAPTTAAHAGAASAAAHAVAPCGKVPELSPKIPALPAGVSCPKPLFRFTSSPAIKLDYVSPLVSAETKESLGLTPTTFELDYVDIKIGTGNLAEPQMYYTLQYTGYLVDGTKFDSSLDRPEPFTFPVGAHRVIPGWDLGFQGMRIGGKRRLYIPFQLGYGDKGQQAIPPRAELIFDIELLSQSKEEPKPKTPPAPPAPPAGAPKPATAPPAGATPPPPPPPPPADKPATPPPAAAAKPATPPTK